MIRANQLFLTRVEPTFSPKRMGGYQVVYRSDGITQAESDEVQKAVEAFVATRGLDTPPRWQFFALTNQKVVIAKTHVIDTDTEIMDETGRRGIFLVHCYVFTRQEFSSIQNNPFAILDHWSFASSTDALRDLIERYGKGTGKADVVEGNVYTAFAPPTHSWSGDEFEKLVRLASNAGKVKSMKKSILLIGTQEDILEALRVALYYSRNKLECTFNTNIDRSQVAPGLYWALGVSAQQNAGSNFIEVNASERRVVASIDGLWEPSNDLYQIWFEELTRRGDIYNRDQNAQFIQQLSEAFTSRRVLNRTDVDALNQWQAACESFESVHRDLIIQRVREAISNHLPQSQLLNQLVTYFDQYVPIAYTLCVAIPAEISPEYLIDNSVRMLEHFDIGRESLKPGDWSAFYKLASTHIRAERSLELAFWATIFHGKGTDKERAFVLKSMRPEQFQRVLQKLFNPLHPADFVARGMPSALLDILLHHPRLLQMTDEQFVALIETLCQLGYTERLDRLPEDLYRRIYNLESEHIQQLERLLSSRVVLGVFVQAVRARIAQLPPQQGFMHRISSLVGRGKDQPAAPMRASPRSDTDPYARFKRPSGHKSDTRGGRREQSHRPPPNAEYQQQLRREQKKSDSEPFQTPARPATDDSSSVRRPKSGTRAGDEQTIKPNFEQNDSTPKNDQ